MTITVVFGDEGVFGGIDCQEAADTCAIVGANTAAATLTILEFADSCLILGQNTSKETLNCQQRPDGCNIVGIVSNVVPINPELGSPFAIEVRAEKYTVIVDFPPAVAEVD